jgi:hypothetical protein
MSNFPYDTFLCVLGPDCYPSPSGTSFLRFLMATVISIIHICMHAFLKDKCSKKCVIQQFYHCMNIIIGTQQRWL